MYKVKLQSFEGPFDLLVYLIESAEMSIYDIEINEITSQYLAYIKEMEDCDVQVAQEFMVLAASLIEIKSKMILPRISDTGEELILEDPRTELVSRILEYKRFKEVSEILASQEDRMQHIFSKPQEDISAYLDNPDEVLSLEINEFANAFKLFIQKKQKVEQVRSHYTRIERERSSMESRIKNILKNIRSKIGTVFNFKELIANKKDRYDVVVTFISVLEMAKERVIGIEQNSTYGDIKVFAGENISDNKVLERYSEEGDFITEAINSEL